MAITSPVVVNLIAAWIISYTFCADGSEVNSADVGDCPSSWYKYGNLTCIRAIDQWKNFSDAQEYCRERYNADLLYYDSKEKEEFVTRYIINWAFPAYWIGLRYQLDLQNTLNYVWLSTNATVQDYTYSNWHSQGNDLSYGQCVTTLNQGLQWQWENNPCQDQFTFICEANITSLDIYKGLNYSFSSNITFINYTEPIPQPLNISINLTDINYNQQLIASTPKLVQGCPYNGLNYNGTCIKMITLGRGFDDARQFCNRHYQGDLVSIESQDKENFILQNLTNEAYGAFWIGLRQYPQYPSNDNETWVATGQRLLPNISYYNIDEDNNDYIENFNCGIMLRTFWGYKWVYTSCALGLIFVCQYESFIPTTSPTIGTTIGPTTVASTPSEESSIVTDGVSSTAILEDNTSSSSTESTAMADSILSSTTGLYQDDGSTSVPLIAIQSTSTFSNPSLTSLVPSLQPSTTLLEDSSSISGDVLSSSPIMHTDVSSVSGITTSSIVIQASSSSSSIASNIIIASSSIQASVSSNILTSESSFSSPQPTTNTPSPTVTTPSSTSNPSSTTATSSSSSTLTPVFVLQQIAGFPSNSSIQRSVQLLQNLDLVLQQNPNQNYSQKLVIINGTLDILKKTNFIFATIADKQQLAQIYINVLTTVMQISNQQEQRPELAFQIMAAEEELGQRIGQTLPSSQAITAQTNIIDFRVVTQTAADLARTGYRLFWQVGSEAYARAAIALPKEPFSALDPNTVVKIKVSFNRELSKYFSSNVSTASNPNDGLVSVILSCTVTPDIPINYNFPLNYTIPHLQATAVNKNKSCVFWENRASSWSSDGCRVSDSNSNLTFTACSCDHLTHFALLLQVKPTIVNVSTIDFTILGYMTYVGSGISIFCITLTLFIYSLLRLKGDRFIVHRNLLIALMIAQVSLIVATTGASNKVLCQISAVLLHFFYLATFSWMLVEGIHLYFAIIEVYNQRSKLQIYFGVGWGIPVIVVAISAIVRFDSYGQDERCWLSYSDGFIWAFIAPVIGILCANIAIMVAVVKISLAANVAVTRDRRNSLVVKSKSLAKATAVLFPILGMTWVFGLIPVTPQTLIFSYLFVICNSLQGAFIFLFHCVFNSEVRQAYNVIIRRKTTVQTIHQQSSRRKLTTQFSSAGPGDIRYDNKAAASTLV